MPVFLKKVLEGKGKTNSFQYFKDSPQKEMELTHFFDVQVSDQVLFDKLKAFNT